MYYPHWHVYPQGEKWFGKNWTEWEFVKTAKPLFKGHRQPMKPLLGYLDGKSPEDVGKEIELTSNSGIDVFLFDWYFYGDGIQTMSESLEDGFPKSTTERTRSVSKASRSGLKTAHKLKNTRRNIRPPPLCPTRPRAK